LNPILTSSNCCRASTNTTKNETGRPTKADNVEQNYDHFREIHSAVILNSLMTKKLIVKQRLTAPAMPTNARPAVVGCVKNVPGFALAS